MLTTKQVHENIRQGIKMRITDLPLNVGVSSELLITDYIDDEIIADQEEEYIVSQDK